MMSQDKNKVSVPYETEKFRAEMKALIEKKKREAVDFADRSPEEQETMRRNLMETLDSMGQHLKASGVTLEEVLEEIETVRAEKRAQEKKMSKNVVVDTNVLLSAAWEKSLPRQALDVVNKKYNLVSSMETLDELLDVASRPKTLRAFS